MKRDTLSVTFVVILAFIGGMLIGPLSAKVMLGIALLFIAGAYGGKLAATKKLQSKNSTKK